MNSLEILSIILGLRVSEVVMILVLGWIIGSIPIYFIAKYFNKNVSFEKALGATILSETIFPSIMEIFYFLSILISMIMIDINYILRILIFTLLIIVIIIGFIAFLYIYKMAFNVDLGIAFFISILAIIIEIILISIVYAVASGISTVNTPMGTLEIYIIGIIGGFMLGLLLSTIFIYLVAKRLNINISFLGTSIVNLFPGIVSFIITTISSLLFILAENNVAFFKAFFIGGGIIFIIVSIFYKYILNISWRKAIIMSIIFSILGSISGMFTGLISFNLPACC
jgi:hypothetical protein